MSSGKVRSRVDEHVVVNIVTEVAEALGVDPLDLPPLYDVVDTDALGSFVERAPADESTTLRYGDRTVEVRGDGNVTVGTSPVDG